MDLRSEPLAQHIERLTGSIRSQPQAAEHRIALANLAALLGDYDRALQQVQTGALLDKKLESAAHMLRILVRGERLRERVYSGTCHPLILGEPESWLGVYLQALSEPPDRAAELRLSVADDLPELAGRADDSEFSWLCDGDSRLGPCFELILNGEYYWTPATHVAKIDFTRPTSVLDLVWAPVKLKLVNGGAHEAYMPARYPIPSTPTTEDDAILLGSRTEWDEVSSDTWHGRGRRTWLADGEDIPMFQAMTLNFREPNTTTVAFDTGG